MARDVGWLGCRPRGWSASARMWITMEPCQWPSGPGPHMWSQYTSSGANGIQSMPRSRSQARRAPSGARLPETFSYAAMVIHSWPFGFMPS